MKSKAFIPFFIAFLISNLMSIWTTLASEISKGNCAIYLQIPSDYAYAFEKYVNPTYLTPLPYVKLDFGDAFKEHIAGWELDLANIPLNEVMSSPEEAVYVHVDGMLSNENGKQTLHVENMKLSDELDTEYTYRIVAAHLMSSFGKVDEIRINLYLTPDYGILKGLLAMGTDPKIAVMQTPFFKAWSDFGYKLDSELSRIKVQDPLRTQGVVEGAVDSHIVLVKAN